MRIEKSIVSAWAELLTQTAVRDAIDYLQALCDELASDDYQLTVWDSVCIQVRGQHTPFWGAYKDLVDNFLYGHLESLGADEKLALWAQTEEGCDWVEDHYADEDGRTTAPLDDSGILGYLRAAVLATADQYESEVINRSLFPDSCQE